MWERLILIWKLLDRERTRYGAAIAALVIASCFLYLAPLVPQVVIDEVLLDGPEGGGGLSSSVISWLGGAEYVGGNLWLPAVILVALTLCAGFFTYLRGRWSAQASESIVRRLRERLYMHLQRLPVRYFDHAETGDLLQRCSSDVETVRTFLANQVVEIGRATIMLLVPIPLMLAIDARMTIASLVLIPFVLLFSLIFFRLVRRQFKKTDEAEAALTTTLQENLSGIRVVRAFARQAHERDKFHEKNDTHRDLDYHLYRLFAWFWSCSDMLCFLQKAIVIAFGAYLLAIGELGVGAFYYFLTAVTMFVWPMRMMGRILSDLGKAIVALDRIREILDEPEGNAEDEFPTLYLPGGLRGGIRFADVSFAYREGVPALQNVSFELEAGRTLGILGPSGCGKTTIVNLLLRLYDYDEGSIELDGLELRTLSRRFARSQIATVLQEPFLYSRSLRRNLKIAVPHAHDEAMYEAAEISCVHESIVDFENGYDTLIGERGVTLSGGQRQRVALARALLQRPAVLILDDSFSAVDTETESRILQALHKRQGRHSTIIIAHRLSALMHADHLIVLEAGEVVQEGTHHSLIQKEGLYRRLWAIQTSTESEPLDAARIAARRKQSDVSTVS